MIYYVNASASRQGNGTKQMPFKHINDAAKVAMPGDVVSVAPGVYREYVNPVHAGREDARIEYRSEVPLGARITGAELLSGWVPYEGTTWMAKVDNGVFNGFNPYKEPVIGDWYFYPKDPATGKILDMHRGAVYMNDQMFYETFTLEECVKGEVFKKSWQPELSIYKWFAQVDEKETTIYANFQGKNPNEECVEINVRNNCFMPDKKGVGYIDKPVTGEVIVTKTGKNVSNPVSAVRQGLGYVSKDRDKESLMLQSSIQDNIVLPNLDRLQKNFHLSQKDCDKEANEQVKSLRIKCVSAKQFCTELSGGNKQKVAFGKWMGAGCDILILDCPTRGIDIGVKADMYKLINDMKKQGMGIVMISEELVELIGMSDRMVIMKDGHIAAEVMRSPDVTDSQLIEYII